jgi:hypothetical protein
MKSILIAAALVAAAGIQSNEPLGILQGHASVTETRARERCLSLPLDAPNDRLEGPHGDSLVATRCEVGRYRALGTRPKSGWFSVEYRWVSSFTPEDTTRGHHSPGCRAANWRMPNNRIAMAPPVAAEYNPHFMLGQRVGISSDPSTASAPLDSRRRHSSPASVLAHGRNHPIAHCKSEPYRCDCSQLSRKASVRKGRQRHLALSLWNYLVRDIGEKCIISKPQREQPSAGEENKRGATKQIHKGSTESDLLRPNAPAKMQPR